MVRDPNCGLRVRRCPCILMLPEAMAQSIRLPGFLFENTMHRVCEPGLRTSYVTYEPKLYDASTDADHARTGAWLTEEVPRNDSAGARSLERRSEEVGRAGYVYRFQCDRASSRAAAQRRLCFRSRARSVSEPCAHGRVRGHGAHPNRIAAHDATLLLRSGSIGGPIWHLYRSPA